MIELIHLEKKFEDSIPLRDVNAVINDGNVISVIGPSGTGKSTLIKTVVGNLSPLSGRVVFGVHTDIGYL